MAENWVSQVVRSLGSIENEDLDILWNRKLYMKSWHNSKIFENIADFSCMIF